MLRSKLCLANFLFLSTASDSSFAADALIATQAALLAVWITACAALVLIMQSDFAFLESGFARAKNTINVLIGLRAPSLHEQRGLDYTQHHEVGYPEFTTARTHDEIR